MAGPGESKMIHKVKNFSLGDIVKYDGERCKILAFPTRYSVFLINTRLKSGKFNHAKIPIRDIHKVDRRVKKTKWV